MFDSWTDEQFIAWLAGFMDGEGCIYLQTKQQHSVEITLANTEREVMCAIYERMQMGVLNETTYSKSEWKTKYTWRIRNYDDACSLLTRLLPFLVIKRAKAEEAIQRVNMAYAIRDAMNERNQQVRAMKAQGTSTKEIASLFDLSVASVNAICAGQYYEGKRPRNFVKKEMSSWMERTISKHMGSTPNVRTQVTKIPSLPAQDDKEYHSR
jgi:DNA-binding CsgD family transcriptional regulator